MCDVRFYKVNDNLEKWVQNGFYRYVGAGIPKDDYTWDINAWKGITESKLSSSAKAIFFFLFTHRFGNKRVCLYSTNEIAKRAGITANTLKKALEELIEANIVVKVEAPIRNRKTYQYYLTDCREWKVDRVKIHNEEVLYEVSIPDDIFEY